MSTVELEALRTGAIRAQASAAARSAATRTPTAPGVSPALLANKADLVDGKVSPAQLPAAAPVASVVAGSAPGTLHTEYLRGLVEKARAEGYNKVVLPPPSRTDLTAKWRIDGMISLPSGMTVDCSATTIAQTALNLPVFYIAPGVTDVKITAGLLELIYPTGARPTYAELTAAGGTGNQNGTAVFNGGAGVLCYGSRVTVTGRIKGFRNGVRYGTWNGVAGGTTSTGLGNEATGNRCNVTVEEVDFGVVFAQQKGIDVWAEGSYLITAGSPDRPHLVYATGPAEGAVVNGKAYNSTGGAAFLFKQQKNLKSTSLVADNCPSILDVQDARGPHEFGDVFGSNLSALVDGALAEPVRGAIVNGPSAGYGGPGYGTKSINRLRVELASTVPIGQIRVATLDDDWTVGSYEIVYNTNEVSATSRIFHIYGERSCIGPGKIRNLGTGGVMGFRYTTGTRHMLTAAPSLDGVTTGILVDAAATVNGVSTAVVNSLFVVEPKLVRIVGTGTGGAIAATNVPVRMLADSTNSVVTPSTGGGGGPAIVSVADEATFAGMTKVPGTYYAVLKP